jgi:hypothetical protein
MVVVLVSCGAGVRRSSPRAGNVAAWFKFDQRRSRLVYHAGADGSSALLEIHLRRDAAAATLFSHDDACCKTQRKKRSRVS